MSLRPRAPRLPLILVLAAVVAALLPLASSAMALDGLQRMAQGGAAVSALVVDLETGKSVASLNPTLRLTPASVTKLLVAAASLRRWNAWHQFDTQLLIDGPVRGWQLNGNLILKGGGDPSLTGGDLWALVAQLKSAGIRTIDGNLLVVPAPFGTVACGTPDRCKALASSSTAYNAQVSSIGVNFGNWCVTVRPQRPGAPANVSPCASVQLPIPVNGQIMTARAGQNSTFWVERRTDAAGDSLQVGGAIAPGIAPVDVYRAMSNPAQGAGLILAGMLHQMGIGFTGKVIVTTASALQRATPVADFQGQPLSVQLDSMLRFSNNYIADVLTLDLASVGSGPPPTSLAQAGDTLSVFVARNNARDLAADPPAPPLHSGSGLTPTNRLSAQDLVDVLTNMYRDAANFPAFYGGLVVPGQAPFAFLRQGNRPWLTRVALKTGTMNDPRSVFAIAGYLRKQDGGWMAFAILVNGNGSHLHIPLYQSLAAARGDVDAILSRY
ncbi:MAG TPA: D-alanyl-D-alanine carboxypeptidase/D-alanyl-D-alanine-endopeptidase [Nevskiaceae bacterium]